MRPQRRFDPEIAQHPPLAAAGGVRSPARRATPDGGDAESRIVTLRDGARWLITVVARLVSEDAAPGAAPPRLVVRLAPLERASRRARVATVRARSLHAVDDEALRALVMTSPARRRRAVTTRSHGGG